MSAFLAGFTVTNGRSALGSAGGWRRRSRCAVRKEFEVLATKMFQSSFRRPHPNKEKESSHMITD